MATDITTPEEDRNKSIPGRIGYITWALIIALALSFLYSVSLTKEVPNTTYKSLTNPLTNYTIQIPYTRFNSTSLVPQAPVDASYALFQGIMLAVIIVMLIKAETKLPEYITFEEARDLTKKRIALMQEEGVLPRGEISVMMNHKLKHIVVNEERVPFKYILDIMVHDETKNMERYFRAEVNAKTKYSLGFLEAKKPLNRQDICGNCGSDSDLKIITADKLKDFKVLRGIMRGGSV